MALLTTDTPRRPVDATDEELLAAHLVPRRRVGRWVTSALVLAVLAFALQSAARNPRFEWGVIWTYLRAPAIAHGLLLTLWLTVAVMLTGYVLGIGVAAMRLSDNALLRSVSFVFVWFVRSIPVPLQLLFWYEMASLYPQLSVGVPFGPTFLHTGTAHLFSGLLAAYVALSIDVAAFSSEIIRGGLLSVDQSQVEAAQSIGLTPRRIFRRIVLPQAMPSIVPASGSLVIGTLKGTSLLSFIAVQDLLYSAQLIYGQNFKVMPLLLVATIWYLVIVSVLSVGQYYVERRYARGSRREARRPFRQVLVGNVAVFSRTARGQR